MNPVPAFPSVADAMAAVQAGLRFLAAADATRMSAQAQAEAHQVVIHQWGWTVVLNPDGTTTAWNKDKTKVIHSHSPPIRPG